MRKKTFIILICLILVIFISALSYKVFAKKSKQVNSHKNHTISHIDPIPDHKIVDIEQSKNPKKDEIDYKMLHEKRDFLKIVNTQANALIPLTIKTYEGYNQPMHPDIVYIENGFKGFKYYMAYTPYPFMMDKYENPCIVASNDGLNFVTPKGLKNPIAPPPEDFQKGGHFSDTDLIYDNNKLILFFVYNKRGVIGPSKFYKSISDDGVSWSKPELVYQCENPISGYSPAFIKEANLYEVWYISEGNIMSYNTSEDLKNWTKPLKCNINIPEWNIWHVDIIKTDLGYEGLLCARNDKINNRALFYINSEDGLNWTVSPKPIIYPSENGWDCEEIYRSTMLKENGLYRVWYSARGQYKRWGIGYTEGASIDELKGLNSLSKKSE